MCNEESKVSTLDGSGVSPNQKCYCGKTRRATRVDAKQWLCHHCWLLQAEGICYQCEDCPRCDNVIGDKSPQVCAECVTIKGTVAVNKINVITARLEAIG